MTDNEIIKALRFCSDPDTCSCDCSFYVEGETVHECTTKLSVAALDLIQRQQEEIDRLKKENNILSQNSDTAFQDGLNEAQDLYAEQIKNEIKAEAVKEFADRIVERLEEEKKDSNTDVYAYGAYKKAIAIVKGVQNE